jgi:parallel beta-helix repeat protein
MTVQPIGFLSYVRDDDAHERGRLTEFCNRLCGEVRMQGCDEFELFQDRKDIAWGQQWQQRIDNSIDATSFLIPIITPRFFKSPACREEMERFLDREKRLGRNDLILPVYYRDSPVLNDEKKRKTDRLAMIIAERQYADWREMRFEPFTAPQLGKMLARMAGQIVAALDREQPPSRSAKGRDKEIPRTRRNQAKTNRTVSGLSDSTGASKETDSAVETPVMTRGPAAKTEPHTLIVDALHRGDHSTLTAALEAAKPGDRILVHPGLYKEGIIITKAVEIIGDGEPGEVVIEAMGTDVVLFRANMGRIVNLTLRQTGGENWYGIDITQGRLDLEGCDITSRSLACIGIHGGSDPRLRRNRIHAGKGGGVTVYDDAKGTLEDNDIFANRLSAVLIYSGGNPSLRRNRIHDGEQSGVMVYDGGLGVLEDNDIFNNAYSGVVIKTGANPVLRRNRIHDGKEGGVYVYEAGLGTIEDNDMFNNAESGVLITEEGNPNILRNRIHDGHEAGVLVSDKGLGTIEENDIYGNALNGVEIARYGKAVVRRNRISKNKFAAIYVHDGGRAVIEGNDLRENEKGAWNIAKECEKNVKRSGNIE